MSTTVGEMFSAESFLGDSPPSAGFLAIVASVVAVTAVAAVSFLEKRKLPVKALLALLLATLLVPKRPVPAPTRTAPKAASTNAAPSLPLLAPLELEVDVAAAAVVLLMSCSFGLFLSALLRGRRFWAAPAALPRRRCWGTSRGDDDDEDDDDAIAIVTAGI